MLRKGKGEVGELPVGDRLAWQTCLLDSGWSLEARGEDGDTPLTRAVYWRRLETVKTLLLRGTDIETQDDHTPLCYMMPPMMANPAICRLYENHNAYAILLLCLSDASISSENKLCSDYVCG